MLTSEKMDRISTAILRTDLDRVLEELARLGVLHPAHIEELETWAQDLPETDAEQMRAEYEKRQNRIRQLLEAVHTKDVEIPDTVQLGGATLPLGDMDLEISRIEARIAPAMDALDGARALKEELVARAAQVDSLLPIGLPFAGMAQSTFLYMALGSLGATQLSRLQDSLSAIPAAVIPLRQTGETAEVVSIVLRKDQRVLEEALRECNFHETVPLHDLEAVTAEARSEIARRQTETDEEIARRSKELSDARGEVLPGLFRIKRAIDDGLTLLTLKSYCRVSEKTCVLSGWAPSAKTQGILSALHSKTDGRSVVVAEAADDLESAHVGALDVPVLAKLPGFLRPFQLLTDGYGVPAYRTINPTLFVAISFLLMFGMMFGDVGHGLVFAAAGAFLFTREKATRDIAKLLLYCGSMSVVFGLLYGSIFGIETLLPTLWVKPLEHATTLFTAAIAFGIVVISLGLVLNVVNMVRGRTFLREFFDVSGPLTLVAYWSSLGLAIKMFLSKEGTSPSVLLFGLVAVPLLAFFAKGPVLSFAGIQEKAFPEGVVGYLMECAVKILEVLMGCLANTVSFIRVAAFGLAHAGLFVAVFSIAEALPTGPVGTVSSWLVLLAGNVVIIVLEGLVVTIQAIRLEYYEFFGKFFSRMGTKYQPISFSKAVREKAD